MRRRACIALALLLGGCKTAAPMTPPMFSLCYKACATEVLEYEQKGRHVRCVCKVQGQVPWRRGATPAEELR